MIGIALHTILKGSTELETLIEDKIFPYVIDEEVLLPALVYRVNSIEPQYSKDECFQDITTIEIVAFSDGYKNCLQIINEARKALESYKGELEGINITSTRIQNITEGYDFELNTYYSKIILTIKTII